MQPKACLWLCATVLAAALVAGNPFLDVRAAPARPEPAPAASPRERTVPAARGPARERPATSAPARTGIVPAVSLRAPGPVVPATLALHAAPAAGPACPDDALAPHVIRVEPDGRGAHVWVLRDGREMVRNPAAGPGEPLLVSRDLVSQ